MNFRKLIYYSYFAESAKYRVLFQNTCSDATVLNLKRKIDCYSNIIKT